MRVIDCAWVRNPTIEIAVAQSRFTSRLVGTYPEAGSVDVEPARLSASWDIRKGSSYVIHYSSTVPKSACISALRSLIISMCLSIFRRSHVASFCSRPKVGMVGQPTYS